MHVIYDDRIWPSFFYSSSESIKEQILIRSINRDADQMISTQSVGQGVNLITVDDSITVVTFKSKTVQNVLTDIAGLLVLTRILHILLVTFHEWRFNQKMKKETNEEFRDIFTYYNFKRAIVEIQELKEQNLEMKEKNEEMKEQNSQLTQRLENIERFIGYSDDKVKNE